MPTLTETEDTFFDANDDFRNSIGSSSPTDSIADYQDSILRKLEYELWTKELISIQERRKRFLREMGFHELSESSLGWFTKNEEPNVDLSEKHVESEILTSSNTMVLNPSTSCDAGGMGNSFCCIRDLDTGKEFIVYNMGHDGGSNVFKEIGSEKLMTLQEFEISLGISHSVQKHLRKDSSIEGKHNFGLGEKKKASLSWWRSFIRRNNTSRSCKCDVSVSSKVPRSSRIKVCRYRKSRMDLTTVYRGQEIHAHRGSIRTMKFSPCGRYLATGGEDCVVRIWQIQEIENYCSCFTKDGSCKIPDNVKDLKLMLGKGSYSAPAVIPKKIFKINDTPLQELHGHTSDILDLSWSGSDCLLTSSKDKTVRMWKVGSCDCLKVFEHNDYVTCVQFNPVDDAYFISGSIDGKVRIWGTAENRVIDWVDIRDIITAVCHKPDGKGFVVGSIGGDCRFYDYSVKSIQFEMQLSIRGKKKSSGKRITGLQFFPKDTKQIMVTSADSRVRIFNGVDAIHKFKGLSRTKSQFSASFTSDGSHIISVGDDSNVYIWSIDRPCKATRGAKSIRSCEYFFSKGASIAAAWPGMDLGNVGSTERSDPECFSRGTWLFSDGSSRVSATWPEEELPSPNDPSLGTNNSYQALCHHHGHYSNVASIASLWNLVIVTASNDGTIRSFHNYGLPVRL